MNISLKDVSYFLAVAGTTRLSEAADICEVTQPAISKAMRRLEGELGLTLLERHARGTRLTAAGRQFLPMAIFAVEPTSKSKPSVMNNQIGPRL